MGDTLMGRLLAPVLLGVCLTGPGCSFVYEMKRNLINEPLYASLDQLGDQLLE